MLLIASSSMSYGRRVGLFASLGNATSGMILTLLAALGVSALIAMNPLALNVLHLLGSIPTQNVVGLPTRRCSASAHLG